MTIPTYNDGTTTILLGTLSKRYELSDKLISDRRTHSVLHKSEQLFGFKLTTNRPHYPWNYQTYNFRDMEITLSYTLLQQETTYYLKNRTAEIEEASTKTRKTFYTTSKFDISDHPSSQHVSPKDQIHPHFQNFLDSR